MLFLIDKPTVLHFSKLIIYLTKLVYRVAVAISKLSITSIAV